MTAPKFQLMPPLTPVEDTELRASIEAHGVLIAILVDEHGDVIDGHHRQKLAAELGVECPREVRDGLSDEQKRTMARTLNTARRMLTREQRRALIADQLKDTPDCSDNAIAKDLGVSDMTVGKVRADLESTSQIMKLAARQGADGKTRKQPAKKTAPTVATVDAGEIPVKMDTSKLRPTRRVTEAARMLGDFLNVLQYEVGKRGIEAVIAAMPESRREGARRRAADVGRWLPGGTDADHKESADNVSEAV
ncbi:ParB N-terminal domain-containing protein [Paraburkholderia sacchari]|uniref:ParB N-terminal domain-containing protein n=1 Tax=Paraburkholderia sacchari TaxID=159450 RepID=A0A8T6ZL06_9BURK|nr:ParB N-terminal domain-containing protein [Paraburkholderia sacchari]NLP64359.1 ParB N-terminal domain-containing protein [Paraburkholderia sacchari]